MQIISGKVKKPFNVLLYGEPGSGKSTWASQSPSPIFIASDEIDELDVDRMPKVTTYKDAIDQLDWLVKESHGYNTVVIDTIDAIEKIIHQEILDKEKSDKTRSMNKAQGGYGNAYAVATDYMIGIKNKLSILRDKRDMNIIILCHSDTKVTNDPLLGDSYTEYYLTLHHKVGSLFVDWVSAVLFLAFDVSKSENDKFAYGNGDRYLYTQKKPGFIAKNRYHLPAVLEAKEEESFRPFYDGYNSYFDNSVDTSALVGCINELLDNVSDERVREKVRVNLDANTNNPANLVKIKTKVEQLIGV